MSHTTAGHAEAGHGDRGHAPHLQHHFDTPQQQFESVVQGMWLFLATEILLFGGLFCAYAVYRALHPEIFYYAYHHKLLSVPLGTINTCILLCSSFTMAMAVWAAQRSRQKLLVAMLAATLLGGCGFLGIKYVEYKHKWEEGLGWGHHYHPHHAAVQHEEGNEEATQEPPAAEASAPDTAEAAAGDDRWMFEPADTGPRGLLVPGKAPMLLEPDQEVRNVQLFFAVYFLMTGLHGLHVIAGMVLIAWLLVRAGLGHFNADYFTPVPIGGLYWHLVDLIWIYLFPLLYLIH